MVAAAHHVEVIRVVVLIPAVICRSVRSSADRKMVAHRQIEEMGGGGEHVYANLHWAGHVRRRAAIDRQAVVSQVQRIDDGGSEAVLIGDRHRLGPFFWSRAAGG